MSKKLFEFTFGNRTITLDLNEITYIELEAEERIYVGVPPGPIILSRFDTRDREDNRKNKEYLNDVYQMLIKVWKDND